jgi:hypothetical protein
MVGRGQNLLNFAGLGKSVLSPDSQPVSESVKEQ